MSRVGRVHFDGAVYHVYNRLARGEQAFSEEAEAQWFRTLLREVAERDGLTVFAWCLMSNHYHLAVRTGPVSLDRPMRSLQQRVTRRVNARRKVYGPLWQGRYRARLVEDQRYLDRLVIYIHLNPVTAGLVSDPADYRWSGHRELLGSERKPIVDVDEVLRVFGRTRRSARAAYVRRLKGAVEEEWIGEQPGRLPWWRLGRPPKGELEDPEDVVRARPQQGGGSPEERPRLTAERYVELGAEAVGVSLEDIRSRFRSREIVRAREHLAVVGVERYRLRVCDLAREMHKSPDSVTKAIARGVHARTGDSELGGKLDRLDEEIAERSSLGSDDKGGMA